MSKDNKSKSVPFTGKACLMTKQPCGFLAVAYELTIVDGVVTNQIALNSPDLPASAAGAGSRSLWAMFQGDQK